MPHTACTDYSTLVDPQPPIPSYYSPARGLHRVPFLHPIHKFPLHVPANLFGPEPRRKSRGSQTPTSEDEVRRRNETLKYMWTT